MDSVYQIPFAFEMYGRIPVRASSLEDAWNKVEEKLETLSAEEMASLASYLPDSEEIDKEGTVLDADGNAVEGD